MIDIVWNFERSSLKNGDFKILTFRGPAGPNWAPKQKFFYWYDIRDPKATYWPNLEVLPIITKKLIRLGPRYWDHLVWHQENYVFHKSHQMKYFSVIYYLFINYIPILAIKSYRCCCKVYLYHFHIFQRIHLSNILFLWRSSFAWISTTWRARWSF